LRYIGYTTQPDNRLKRHCAGVQKSLASWIQELKEAGSIPEMVILDRVPKEHWEAVERRWIAFVRGFGKLYNRHDGGVYCPEKPKKKRQEQQARRGKKKGKRQNHQQFTIRPSKMTALERYRWNKAEAERLAKKAARKAEKLAARQGGQP